MKKVEEYIRVSELLVRQIAGISTNAENLELEQWKYNSEENEKLLLRMYDDVNLQEKLLQYTQLNTANAWVNLRNEIYSTSSKKQFKIPLWTRIAAAVVLPLMIVSGLLLFNRGLNNNAQQLSEAITPGTKKAVLLINNKEVLDLSNNSDTTLLLDGLVSVENKQAALIYRQADKQKQSKRGGWHTVIVPKGGEYKLTLSDGTNVWLNSDSRLSFISSFTGKERIVQLEGEAYFDVSHNPNQPFIVETNDMKVKVYGTGFNVKSYDNESVDQVTLVEGSVGIKLVREAYKEIRLNPDMQFCLNKDTSKGVLKSVIAGNYVGWKDGVFQFNDEDLESVLNKLARWYNVEVKFESVQARSIRFSGEVKRLSQLPQVLELLEIGSGIKLEVSNRVIKVKSLE
ncbi:FecR family protein [Carboxylicivirga sp. RSCT41]|uniref:FecR family protein n=1 Tax=Carboxylicivirga agarovorans TaxID=3417570 RepID=UPI003D35281A